RYLPRTTRNRSIIASVFFGASGAAIWLIAIGAYLAIRLGASDGLLGIKTAGDNIGAPLGSLVAFFLAAGLAATMGMNAYGGMLTVLTGLDSLKGIRPTRRARIITILVLTAVWFVVGKSISTDAVGTLFSALTLMLYLLVPWTATNLVDFFFVRRGHYAIADLFTPSGIYGAWSWRGLVAYGAGFLAEIPFMVVPDINGHSFTGPIAKQISSIDLAWIVGLAVSAVVYIALTRSMDVRAEARAVESSDAQLAGAAP
ncbi:MAG: nucleobase:cation symporter, family, partial [Solirubrobacteraceae bacterium]|nr:nucleobase:cation symporter, family [Solirubrobacteraceae bacterium]